MAKKKYIAEFHNDFLSFGRYFMWNSVSVDTIWQSIIMPYHNTNIHFDTIYNFIYCNCKLFD